MSALREKFNAALGNDLNTSLAITALYDVLKYKTNDATKLFVLDDFDKVLSLDLCKRQMRSASAMRLKSLPQVRIPSSARMAVTIPL